MTTWVKVYNSLPSHPKYLLAGDRAGWLAICGLCYSNEHLTDGFIPQHVLPVVAPGVRRPEELAQRLVIAGLWHEVDGGWQIHGYEEHQRSADEVRERRAADSARKAKQRSNESPQNVRADSARNPVGVRSLDVEGRKQKAEKTETPLRADALDCFAYWQEKCGHPNALYTAKRQRAIEGRLKDGYAASQIRMAIEKAALYAYVNEQGTRFDDIELICRSGEKLEGFLARGEGAGQVVPLRRESPSDLWRAINGDAI